MHRLPRRTGTQGTRTRDGARTPFASRMEKSRSSGWATAWTPTVKFSIRRPILSPRCRLRPSSICRKYAGVQLASGLVLFTGANDGVSADGSTFAALYDPNSGLVTPTGSMNTPRMDQTMVLLPDGTVLVAGGQISGPDVQNREVSSAEVYDPASATFSPTGNMAGRRFRSNGDGAAGRNGSDGWRIWRGQLDLSSQQTGTGAGAVHAFRKRYWARRHLESGDRAACFRAKSSGGR